MTAAFEIPRRRLGVEGPELSVMGLGGWEAGGGSTWGYNGADSEVVRALRHGWDMGANWIDTSEVYARGRSEELIGRALRGREDIRVMTKVAPRPDGSGVRTQEIGAAIEGSLRRLRRDSIDVYFMHWRDSVVPLEETWGAMGELVARGLARHIGLSNVSVSDLETCARMRRVDALQLQGSLLFRAELDELVPICQRIGAGVVCYGSLAYGLLSGRFSNSADDWRIWGGDSEDLFVTENYKRFFAPSVLPRHLRRVAALKEIAAELGMTTAQAALLWLVGRLGVTAAIVGSRSVDHIEENLTAGGIVLDAARNQQITELGT